MDNLSSFSDSPFISLIELPIFRLKFAAGLQFAPANSTFAISLFISSAGHQTTTL